MKGTKEKLINEIAKYKCWVSIKQIDKNLKGEMDKTTIYRNLKRLSENWEILEDLNINWEKVYKNKNCHHHHFYCTECRTKKSIWCNIERTITDIEKEKWFKVTSHTFILSWICDNCKK
jgi:Fe2+ or Zn2+ uptake regulation protein